MNRMYTIMLLIYCMVTQCANVYGISSGYIHFEQLMDLQQYPKALAITTNIVGIDGAQYYSFVRDLYESNNMYQVSACEKLKIPKIIHHIWLGSPVPDVFGAYIKSWQEFHGDEWEHMLWTDTEIAMLGLHNQEFYDATDNYGMKSDIARYEIVYRFGGVYVDIDFECLRSFDLLHYTYDFYTGLQPLDSFFLQLNNALFGACPGHPILKECIESIKENWHKYHGAPQKVGPVHFTRAFYRTAGKGTCDIALPACYFYPLGTQDTVINRTLWKRQGAYAVHWWAKSWMPKEYRRKRFQSIDNDSSTYSWND